MDKRGTGRPGTRQHFVRHALADRIFHWSMAAAMLVLLATAFLPIVGVKFPWVVAHWVAGLVLIAAVLFHIVRAVVWQDLRQMLIGPRDISDLLTRFRISFGKSQAATPRSGKYLLAQRLYHHTIAVIVLALCVTGGLMMVRINTPLWDRNPYWLPDQTWGIIFVIHGFAAMAALGLILIHIYFALRPEKLWYTRSMIKGWMTRTEYETHHDPDRWKAEPTAADPPSTARERHAYE